MISHHYQKVESIMPEPKQTKVKRNTKNLEFVVLKNAFDHSFDYVVKRVFFFF